MALPVNGSTHLIPALLLIYRPRKDERLSWPSWLTCSGWFTHISGQPSAAGRAQDRESSPIRDRRSTTVLRHQPDSVESFCSNMAPGGLDLTVKRWWRQCRLDKVDPLLLSEEIAYINTWMLLQKDSTESCWQFSGNRPFTKQLAALSSSQKIYQY